MCHAVRTASLLITSASLVLIVSFSGGCIPERNDGGKREPAVVTSVQPDSGPRTGGVVVRVEGSGFGAAPFVTLGASIVETFVLVTDDAIEFLAPPDNVGPASLTVTNAGGGRATLVNAFFYTPLTPTAYERRFFADSPDEAGANPVLVTATAQSIAQVDLDVPRADTGCIEGRLTDGAGSPLVGHDVLAVSAADGNVVATLTAIDGRFSIEGLVAGAWTVRTDEDPSSTLADQAWPGVTNSLDAEAVEVVAGSATSAIDLALDEGGTIRGTVSGSGAAIEGAIVRADPVAVNPLQFAYAVTDATGAWEISGLAAGEYRVAASAFGSGHVSEYFPDATSPGNAAPVTVAAGAEATVAFDLDPGGSLSGEVIEDSATPGPLPGVLVVAHGLSNGLTFATATAGDGTWRLGEVPAGDYRVEAPELGQFFAGVYGTAGAAVLDVVAGVEESEVSFLGRIGETPCADAGTTGTVTGAVSTRDGDPLFRVSVQLLPTSGGDLAFATTGRDGVWTADCVMPGVYTVRFVPVNMDLLGVDGPAGVAVGTGTVSGVDAQLPPGAALSGTVRDAQTNAPLASVPVRVRNPGTGASRIVQTGGDGRWSADRTSGGGIGPGSWHVEALPHVQSEHSPY